MNLEPAPHSDLPPPSPPHPARNPKPISQRHSKSGRLHPPARKKNYLLATLFLLLAIGVGAVIGFGGSVIYFRNKKFRPPSPQEFTAKHLETMKAAIALTPAETAEIERLSLERMETISAIRKEMFGKIREQMHALSDDVDAILGPERAAAWENDVKKRTGRDRRPPPRHERH